MPAVRTLDDRHVGRIVLKPRVTVTELAEALRCHPETVRRHWRVGNIPGSKLGGGLTFAAADVADFLAVNGITNVILVDQ
jgi:excisionase family DNA binding protein